jgi:hypothetical protein
VAIAAPVLFAVWALAFFVGTAFAGIGFGGGFQRGIRLVVPAVVVLAALALAGLLAHRPPKPPAARHRAAAPSPAGRRASR